jgi:hypothetical protein
MSLFIEVDSQEKQCPVIINLDIVSEIAPLAAGGCAIFMPDGTGGSVSMKVKNDYSEFKQFVLQTVSSSDIAKQVKKLKGSAEPLEIPKL